MIGPAKIVVRYVNGKTLKGYSQDFSPTAPHFHVRRNETVDPISGNKCRFVTSKLSFSSAISQEIIPMRSGRRL